MSGDERMNMEEPGWKTYSTSKKTKGTEGKQRCPILTCGAWTEGSATMTTHIAKEHPMIKTEWMCSCGKKGFTSKLNAQAHVTSCFEGGRLRSKPTCRTEWTHDTYTGRLVETKANMVHLRAEGDLTASKKEQEYELELRTSREKAVDIKKLEALPLPLQQVGPRQIEFIEIAYTDGAAAANGSKYVMAGIGVYYERGLSEHIAAPLLGPVQSNNRAEITADIHALQDIKKMKGLITYSHQRIKLRTDSAIFLGGLHGGMERWKRQGWRRNNKQPLANVDLWKRAMLTWVEIRNITKAVKVKAHTGVVGNENADKLAVLGAFL